MKAQIYTENPNSPTMTFPVPDSLLAYFDKAGIAYKVKANGSCTNYREIETEMNPFALLSMLLCADKHGNDRSFASVISFPHRQRRSA
jgi:hypothetical protein